MSPCSIRTVAPMSRIVVLGGSVAGLLSAMQLARGGHHVTVLEREAPAALAQPAAARPSGAGTRNAGHGATGERVMTRARK